MFCFNCGNKCSDNAKFCTACGTRLQIAVPQQVVQEEIATGKETVPEPVAEPVAEAAEILPEVVETVAEEILPVAESSTEEEETVVEESLPEEEPVVAEEPVVEEEPVVTEEPVAADVQPEEVVIQPVVTEEEAKPAEDAFWKEDAYAEKVSIPSGESEPQQTEKKEKKTKKEKPEKPKKEKKVKEENTTTPKKAKKEKSAVGYFFSTFFSVIFLFLLIVLNVALLSRITCGAILGDSTKSGILKNVDLASIPVGSFMSDSKIEGVEIDEDDELSDVVLAVLQDAKTKIKTEDQVEDLLKSIRLEGLLDAVKEGYVNLLTGEEESACIKADDIVDFVDDNKKIIKKELDIELSDRDIERVGEYLEENEFEFKTKVELPAEKGDQITKIAKLLIGDNVILYVLLGTAIAIVLLLILACNLDKKRRVCVYAGISLIVASVACLAVSMFKGTLLALAVDVKSSVLDDMLVGVGSLINKNSLIFLAIGGALILVYIICELIVKLINRNNE